MDRNPVEVGGVQVAVANASTIMYEVNTFFAMLKVNDALLRIARAITGRCRRASEAEQDRDWWLKESREIYRAVVGPLLDELAAYSPKDGYGTELVMQAIENAALPLLDASTEAHAPRVKSDLQLVEEHLQVAFEKLREKIVARAGDPAQLALLQQLGRHTFREWFKDHAGYALRRRLEALVVNEQRSVPKKFTENDYSLFMMLGMELGCHQDELDAILVAEDEWESLADSRFSYDFWINSKGWRLGWYECDTEAKAILFAVTLMEKRIKAKEDRKEERRRKSASFQLELANSWTHRRGYFCALCDELTEWQSASINSKVTNTEHLKYCKKHAQVSKKANQSNGSYLNLIRKILIEANKDFSYLRRFLCDTNEVWAEAVRHINSCRSCSGQGHTTYACLDPSANIFTSLMAFHANVRKVAARLRDGYCDIRACTILDAVQNGEIAKNAAHRLGFVTDKAAGQYGNLALVWLYHQGFRGAELSRRAGVWPNAISERLRSLRGIFDFSPERDKELIAFPFDDFDINGPNVVKFLSGSGNWRHTEDKYRHLISRWRPVVEHHRHTGSSSEPLI